MKTKTFTLSFLFFLMLAAALSAQTWGYVPTLQNEWLQKICTQGLDTVYIVGRNGLIAKSTDRIQTWNKQYTVTAQLNDIIFCNHTTGFAVGNNGTILRTTDAGASWTQQPSGITLNLNAIAATSAGNIWVVGDSGKVVFSTNAGTTWQVKDFSTTAKLNDISFRNNEGYIVGNAHACFFSSDEGNNWEFKNIVIENPYYKSDSIFDLLSVSQTENKNLYVLYVNQGSHFWNIYFNGNTYPIPLYNTSSLCAINDSISIAGAFYGIPTGGATDYAKMELFKCKYGNWIGGEESYLPLPSLVPFDEFYCDIRVVNDTIGYVVSGECLFRIDNDQPAGLSLSHTNDGVVLRKENGYLKAISENRMAVEEMKVTSLSGGLFRIQRGNHVNVSNLPFGTYIVNILFEDKTYFIRKWIKD